MKDLVKKIMYAGAGLAFMTKEKIEEISKDLVEKGKLTEKEGKEVIDDLVRRSKEAKAKVEGQIENAVQKILRRMNLVTKEDLLKLEKRVKALEKEIGVKKPKA